MAAAALGCVWLLLLLLGGGGGREEEEVCFGVTMTNTEIFHIFHINSLFNLPFFHIFHIFSLYNLFFFHNASPMDHFL